MDRYFTISALLGRLKEPMRLPPPIRSVDGKGREEDVTEPERQKRKVALDKQQVSAIHRSHVNEG